MLGRLIQTWQQMHVQSKAKSTVFRFNNVAGVVIVGSVSSTSIWELKRIHTFIDPYLRKSDRVLLLLCLMSSF